MSDPMMIAPGWLIPAGLGGVAVMKALDWWLSRKSTGAAEGGTAALIEGLTARVKMLEDQQRSTDLRIADEMRARMIAEEAAHQLSLRIATLEHAMAVAGLPIPPPTIRSPS